MYLDLDKANLQKTAIIDMKGNSISYNDILSIINDIELVMKKRTVALLFCTNDAVSVINYLCCMANQVVPLLIGRKTDLDSVKRIIDLYHPKYIFGLDKDVNKLQYTLHKLNLPKILEINQYGIYETDMDGFELYKELSLLLTTSGSTGSPKLVRHSYSNLERQARNISSFFEMDGTERPIIDLPMQYTYGLSIINSHLFAGATLLMADESIMSKKFWAFFVNERATCFTGVPYSFELLKKLHFFNMELPSLKILSQGGGKFSKELHKEFAEYITAKGGRYVATYGQTEGSARMAYLPSELAVKKCGSIGVAIPEGRLYLRDDNAKIISGAHIEGEMYYEGPNVTLGYAECGADLSKGDERNGILATGDMAYFDEDGCFYITGRRNRFLKLYGYRVNLDECEQIVKAALPCQCACVGNDSRIVVCITEKGLAKAAKARLIAKTDLYANTIEVKYIEEIPKNPAGKILYHEIEKMVEL